MAKRINNVFKLVPPIAPNSDAVPMPDRNDQPAGDQLIFHNPALAKPLPKLFAERIAPELRGPTAYPNIVNEMIARHTNGTLQDMESCPEVLAHALINLYEGDRIVRTLGALELAYIGAARLYYGDPYINTALIVLNDEMDSLILRRPIKLRGSARDIHSLEELPTSNRNTYSILDVSAHSVFSTLRLLQDYAKRNKLTSQSVTVEIRVLLGQLVPILIKEYALLAERLAFDYNNVHDHPLILATFWTAACKLGVASRRSITPETRQVSEYWHWRLMAIYSELQEPPKKERSLADEFRTHGLPVFYSGGSNMLLENWLPPDTVIGNIYGPALRSYFSQGKVPPMKPPFFNRRKPEK